MRRSPLPADGAVTGVAARQPAAVRRHAALTLLATVRHRGFPVQVVLLPLLSLLARSCFAVALTLSSRRSPRASATSSR